VTDLHRIQTTIAPLRHFPVTLTLLNILGVKLEWLT